MKIHEIIHETPYMVPQEMYPADFERTSIKQLQRVTMDPSDLKEEYRDGNVRIMSNPFTMLYLFVDDLAVGVMHLVDSGRLIRKIIGAKAWQVMNVYLLPEHRNKRFGLTLYNFVLHHRKHAFASGAAMTPASRRVYNSLLKDPSVEVYALVKHLPDLPDIAFMKDLPDPTYERQELKLGSKGITTGDSNQDNESTFVAIAK